MLESLLIINFLLQNFHLKRVYVPYICVLELFEIHVNILSSQKLKPKYILRMCIHMAKDFFVGFLKLCCRCTLCFLIFFLKTGMHLHVGRFLNLLLQELKHTSMLKNLDIVLEHVNKVLQHFEYLCIIENKEYFHCIFINSVLILS